MAAKKKINTTSITGPVDDGKTILDKNSGKMVINMKMLEPEVKKEVATLTTQLQKAVSDFGTSALRMGEILSKVELLLKPRGVFVPYLNSLPGFSQATAYRFINGYRNAKEKYAPHVLELVLASGMAMIGNDKQPYGKYTDVVKKLPPPAPTGNEAQDKERARQWLGEVEKKYKETRKKGAKTFNTLEAQKEVYRFCLKRIQKVPDNNRIKWIRETFGYVLGGMQLTQDMPIEPKSPPESFGETGPVEGSQEEV